MRSSGTMKSSEVRAQKKIYFFQEEINLKVVKTFWDFKEKLAGIEYHENLKIEI